MNTEEKPYWERLELSPDVVGIVKESLKTKLWQGTWPDQMAKLQALNRAMSEHYKVPEVRVELHPGISPCYIYGKKIILNRPSLVSWAHEFAHHLLYSQGKAQNEDFPRAFSLGLFYRAAPKMFGEARKRGRLLFSEVS